MNPSERGRRGAEAKWARVKDRSAATAKARVAFESRFADAAERSAYFADLAARSLSARGLVPKATVPSYEAIMAEMVTSQDVTPLPPQIEDVLLTTQEAVAAMVEAKRAGHHVWVSHDEGEPGFGPRLGALRDESYRLMNGMKKLVDRLAELDVEEDRGPGLVFRCPACHKQSVSFAASLQDELRAHVSCEHCHMGWEIVPHFRCVGLQKAEGT